MKRKPVRMSEEGMARLILEAGRNYSTPALAFKEFPTNHVDACYRFGKQGRPSGAVEVLLDHENSTIVVRDSAGGMSAEKMFAITDEVGQSDKIGREDERGEKGVGLLAFAALGDNARLHLLSRTPGEREFNYNRYGINQDRIEVEMGNVSASEMDSTFYGSFEHGTRAILNIDPRIFKAHFAGGALKRFLQATYAPLLFRSDIPFYFGNVREGSEILEPQKFNGNLLVRRTLEFLARTNEEGVRQNIAFPVFVHLFLDPEKKDGKVGVFAKDVRVYNAISQMEERLAALPLWGCGSVSGYINSSNLRLVLGRESVRKGTNAYRGLVTLLEGLNEDLWPEVEDQLHKGRAGVGEKRANEMLTEMRIAYSHTEPLNKEIRIVINRPGENNGKIHEEERERKKGTGGGSDKDKGPRKFPFVIKIYEFDVTDQDMRSKIGEEMGRPAIEINSGHVNYARNVLQGSASDARDYFAIVQATPIAVWEVQEALQSGRIFGDASQTAQIVARRAQDLIYAVRSNSNGRK